MESKKLGGANMYLFNRVQDTISKHRCIVYPLDEYFTATEAQQEETCMPSAHVCCMACKSRGKTCVGGAR